MIDKGIKELASNKEELEILEINFQTLEEKYELKLEELSTTKADLNKSIEVIENTLDCVIECLNKAHNLPQMHTKRKKLLQYHQLQKDSAEAFLQSMKGK